VYEGANTVSEQTFHPLHSLFLALLNLNRGLPQMSAKEFFGPLRFRFMKKSADAGSQRSALTGTARRNCLTDEEPVSQRVSLVHDPIREAANIRVAFDFLDYCLHIADHRIAQHACRQLDRNTWAFIDAATGGRLADAVN
jgi:hypothetical protein